MNLLSEITMLKSGNSIFFSFKNKNHALKINYPLKIKKRNKKVR